MKIGIPTEIKNNEFRVAMVPGGVRQLVDAGHQVFVQAGAGLGSGITDEVFGQAGATIIADADELWASAEMIIKVKEPLPPEHDRIQKNQVIYTYFHLAAVPELVPVLLEKNVAAVAYETIQTPDGQLPLLRPMSEVAGRMAVQVGARCLEKEMGGSGVLLGGVPGVARGRVVIIGAGIVGTHAAKIAVGMGAAVQVLDINLARLNYLEDVFGSRIDTMYSNHENICRALENADLVVGAVLIPGARAPRLVTEEMLDFMPPGSCVVDVSVDQGGCIETCRPTTHADPTYVVRDVIHYCVANMPGAVPRTSTYALTNATTPYALAIANQGVKAAIARDPALRLGVNSFGGYITHEVVAESLGQTYKAIEDML